MNFKNIFKNTIILFIITFILSIALSSVKFLTRDIIEKTKIESIEQGYREVLKDYHKNIDITNLVATKGIKSKARLISCLEVYDEKDEKIGYIVLTTIKGYGGQIKIITGFDTNGNITGLVYPDMLKETPGVGMKVLDSSFIDTFIDKNNQNIEEVDTITSATVSSKAVKNSIIYASQIVDVAKNMN